MNFLRCDICVKKDKINIELLHLQTLLITQEKIESFEEHLKKIVALIESIQIPHGTIELYRQLYEFKIFHINMLNSWLSMKIKYNVIIHLLFNYTSFELDNIIKQYFEIYNFSTLAINTL